MLVKTFQAGNMSEALRMVKAEMGGDAMILTSRKERRKGLMGLFSAPIYEVTAALDPRPAPLPATNPYLEKPVREPEVRELSTREEFQNSMLAPLARELKELRQRVETLSQREQEAPPQAPRAPQTQTEWRPLAAEPESPVKTLAREELDELKKVLLQALGSKDKGEPVPVVFPVQSTAEAVLPARSASRARKPAQQMEQLTAELGKTGLSADNVTAIVDSLRLSSTGAGEEALQELLLGELEARIKCSGALKMKRNGPRLLALVGPTGVGKTTTAAKLAAMYALNKKADVALITTDTFRVGAIEQLKIYARIMGISLDVAATQQELEKVIADNSDKDLIIIDTAGRSPRDKAKLAETRSLLEAQPGIEIHLCLAATTREDELQESISRFSMLPVSRLIFTKLDECSRYGDIVNAHLASKLPLSYLTGGQQVPEDIEAASSNRLANLLLQGGSAWNS